MPSYRRPIQASTTSEASVLDMVTMDNEKHRRLLTTVRKMIGG